MSTSTAHPKGAAQAYLESSLETAPPIKIVRLLYEGALRFLDRATTAQEAGRRAEFTLWLRRVDSIVNELRASLDHEVDPEISRNLDRLYEFVQARLSQAILKCSTEPLPAARTVLEKLFEGWRGVEVETTGRSE